MQVVYEPWLVLLSIVMAIQGAYVGFTLASQLGDAVGVRRRVLLAGAAFSLAVAVWTMHFVGMLAARISFPIDYLVFPTLLSLLVCVLVVGVAVFAISSGPFSLPRLFLSACLMGGGIFSMHYIGMTALHASAHMEHAPFFVTASSHHCHRRIRFGALACEGRSPPTAIDTVVSRFRHSRFGNALYRDGGNETFSAAGNIECAGAFN